MELLQADPNTASGWHELVVNGESGTYYCDMDSAGGGWTRVVRQTESEPVVDWDGGVNGASYALAQSRIPAHGQVAFGRNEDAAFADYVDWTYTTGPIHPYVAVTSPASGLVYHIHRSPDYFHHHHDPEQFTYSSSVSNWFDTLTFDLAGGPMVTWAFGPRMGTPCARGFALLDYLVSICDSHAWTVWVR